MVRESAHGGGDGALLTAARSRSRDEDAGVLAPEGAGLPLLAGVVEEGLPLGGEVPVAGRDAEQERIVALHDIRGDEGDLRGLAGSVHLCENLFGEGLCDLVEVGFSACCLDASFLGLG